MFVRVVWIGSRGVRRRGSIYFFSLHKSEFEFCFFCHHVFVPFGFEDEVYLYVLYVFYALESLFYVFEYEVCGGAVGCGECHVDF